MPLLPCSSLEVLSWLVVKVRRRSHITASPLHDASGLSRSLVSDLDLVQHLSKEIGRHDTTTSCGTMAKHTKTMLSPTMKSRIRLTKSHSPPCRPPSMPGGLASLLPCCISAQSLLLSTRIQRAVSSRHLTSPPSAGSRTLQFLP